MGQISLIIIATYPLRSQFSFSPKLTRSPLISYDREEQLPRPKVLLGDCERPSMIAIPLQLTLHDRKLAHAIAISKTTPTTILPCDHETSSVIAIQRLTLENSQSQLDSK